MTGWQPGNLALCVASGTWVALTGELSVTAQPRAGGIYTVAEIVDFEGCTYLGFSEFAEDCWAAVHFRRIAPLTEPEHRRAVEELSIDVRRPVPVPERAHKHIDGAWYVASAVDFLGFPASDRASVGFEPCAQPGCSEAKLGADRLELVGSQSSPLNVCQLASGPETTGKSQANRNERVGGQAERNGDRQRYEQRRHVGHKAKHDGRQKDQSGADGSIHGSSCLLSSSERPINPCLLGLKGPANSEADRRARDGVENLDGRHFAALAVEAVDGGDLVVHFHSPLDRWAEPDEDEIGPLALLVNGRMHDAEKSFARST